MRFNICRIISTSDAFGTGQANTTAFVNYCTTNTYGLTNNAIGESNNSTNRGYSDWFLPSQLELSLIYSNLKLLGLGDSTNLNYFSSTAYPGNPGNIISTVNFANGNNDFLSQSNPYGAAARAVRIF